MSAHPLPLSRDPLINLGNRFPLGPPWGTVDNRQEEISGTTTRAFSLYSTQPGPGSGRGVDPLTVALLPLGDRIVQVPNLDQDVPGEPFCIPFGLTRLMVPEVHAIDLGGASYDSVRQIAVMPDGTPFIDAPSMKSTLYCSTTTTEDMQSWPDTVPDGSD